jgi:hypothetical protein
MPTAEALLGVAEPAAQMPRNAPKIYDKKIR